MNYDVIMRPFAEADLCEHIEYYRGLSSGLAERFSEAVARAIEILQEHPRIGSPYEAKTRPPFPPGCVTR